MCKIVRGESFYGFASFTSYSLFPFGVSFGGMILGKRIWQEGGGGVGVGERGFFSP